MSEPPPQQPPTTKPPGSDALDSVGSSQVSIGFDDGFSAQPSNVPGQERIRPLVQLTSDRGVPHRDVCALGLYCGTHDKFLIRGASGPGGGVSASRKGLFLPFTRMRASDSWRETAARLVRSLLRAQNRTTNSNSKSNNGSNSTKKPSEMHAAVRAQVASMPLQLVDHLRVQWPKRAPHFLTRVIYVAKLAPITTSTTPTKTTTEKSSPTTSPPSPMCTCEQQITIPPPVMGQCSYKWYSLDEIRARQESLWGTEPVEILAAAREQFQKKSETPSTPSARMPIHHDEYAIEDAMRELVPDLSSCGRWFRAERELLYSAQFTQDIVLKLANEYIAQCFPARHMTLVSFRVFMFKLGWFEGTADEQSQPFTHKQVFSTFTAVSDPAKCRQVPYLTFNELLVGLAAIDDRAYNRGSPLRIRLAYVFHSFDRDHDGKWNYEEVERLAQEVTNKGEATQISREMSRNTDAIRRQASPFADPSKREMEEIVTKFFNLATGNSGQPLRNTATITLEQLKSALDKDSEWFATITECLFRAKSPLLDTGIDGALAKLDYAPAPDRVGLLASQIRFTRYDGACEQCHCTMLGRIHLGSFGVRVDLSGAMRGSLNFNLVATYKDVLFRSQVPISETAWCWIIEFVRYVSLLLAEKPPTRPSINVRFDEVLARVRDTVLSEPAVLRLSSPCLVIGEMHSNLPTLYALLNELNGWMPFVSGGITIIVSGNFIEQDQPQASDTLVYLLCLKALLPRQVILLRGPLEARARLLQSAFQRQIQAQYGDAAWKEVCAILDHLPYGAIVDDDCFITKSGIPLTGEPLGAMEAFKPPTKKPAESVHLVNIILGEPVRNIVLHSAATTCPPGAKNTAMKNSPPIDKMLRKSDCIKSVGAPPPKSKPKESTAENNSKQKDKHLIKVKKAKRSRPSVPPPKSSNSKKASKKKSTSKSSSAQNSSRTTISSVTGGISPPGFTLTHLQRFLCINRLSRVIRTDMIPPEEARPYRISPDGSLITLGGIGKQQHSISGNSRLYAAVALLNRCKIRLLRLETALAPFSYL